jgi:hypothetical protein
MVGEPSFELGFVPFVVDCFASDQWSALFRLCKGYTTL